MSVDTAVRIRRHTIQDAPVPSRPSLTGIVRVPPTGKLLNLPAQLARSSAVLATSAGAGTGATSSAGAGAAAVRR